MTTLLPKRKNVVIGESDFVVENTDSQNDEPMSNEDIKLFSKNMEKLSSSSQTKSFINQS